MRKFFFTSLFFILIYQLSAQAVVIQEGNTIRIVNQPLSVFNDELKMKTFDQVWNTINDSYFDQNFNGKDWLRIKEKYLPLIEKCSSVDSLHFVLNNMVNELGTSHLGIFTMDQVTQIFSGSPTKGIMGIQFTCIDSKVIVLGFTDDYNKKYGISIGDELIAVNKVNVKDIYDNYEKINNTKISDKQRINQLHLQGNINDTRFLTFKNNKNKNYSVKIKYVKNTTASNPFTIKMIDDVALIKLKTFNMAYHDKLKSAFPKLKKAKAWILDLRNNPGGGENLEGSFIQYVSSDSVSLGSQIFRDQIYNEIINGKSDYYKGPIIILINEASGSASEVLAACLQEKKRAVIIGKKSAGRVLSSTMVMLPTGAQLQLATGNYMTPEGNILEGVGVQPDIPVIYDQNTLKNGEDPYISKALEYIKNIKG